MNDNGNIVNSVSIFLSGCSKDNLQISNEKGVLSWIQRKKELKIGDYMSIYYITEKIIIFLLKTKYDILLRHLYLIYSKNGLYFTKWYY